MEAEHAIDNDERYDTEEVISPKIEALVEAIKNSHHLVVFTGAGISTSAGIPDFRGPQGVWTLRNQGKPRTEPTTPILKAHPTLTHMALVKLQQEGILKHLISQNSDGMHRRSGIQPEKLSELHGNSNIETCSQCESKFYRDFKVTASYRFSVHDHRNGRYCPKCGGILRDTIINFGESLSEPVLSKAWKETENADVFISIGSSLLVSPACNMPGLVAKNGGKLFIINLQFTPFDENSVKIHAPCDEVFQQVMKKLGLEIPIWIKQRKLVMQIREKQKEEMLEFGALDGDLFATVCKNIEVLFEDETIALESEPFVTPLKGRRNFLVRFRFIGHHGEPPFEITHELCRPFQDHSVIFNLFYHIQENKWKLETKEQINNLVFDFPAPKVSCTPFDAQQALQLLNEKIAIFKRAALICKQLNEFSDAISYARTIRMLKSDVERVKSGAIIDVNLLPEDPSIVKFMRPRSSKELLTVDVDGMQEPSPVENIISNDVLEYEIDQIMQKEENGKGLSNSQQERLKKLQAKLELLKNEAESGKLVEKDYINSLLAKIDEEEIRAQLFLNRQMPEWASQALHRSRIMQNEVRSTLELK